MSLHLMRFVLTSSIMARTTLDIDDAILRELKRLQKRKKKSLGRLASDLLATALKQRSHRGRGPREFRWVARDMRPRIDIDDKEALHAALDRPDSDSEP